MRVCFYFGGFAPLGGIETFASDLLKGLHDRGLEVSLIYWGEQSELVTTLQAAGIGMRSSTWRWGCQYRVPDWLLLAKSIGTLKGVDIILFGKHPDSKILSTLRRVCDTRTKFVFITPYHPQEEIDHLGGCLPPQYSKYDEVWVQAPSFATTLRDSGFKRSISVIPYLFAPHQSVVDFPTTEIRVGFLGRIVADKDVPLLLSSFKHLIELVGPNSSIKLSLFGEGNLRSSMNDLSRTMGLSDRVCFHGGVSRCALADAISSCHLFVFTSRVEGQCLAALEVLSGGRPVVAIDVGAFAEILADRRLGRLVSSRDAKEVSARMADTIELINSKQLNPLLIRRALYERYDPQIILDRYTSLLSGLRA